MGFFKAIKHSQIKSFIKGACRAMLFSFGVAEAEAKKGKIEVRVWGDLAAKALSNRPGWKIVEKNIFEHKSGIQLKISEEYSLADVILSVVLIEMEEFILNDNNPEGILEIINGEFVKFFSLSDEACGQIARKNQVLQVIWAKIQLKNYEN